MSQKATQQAMMDFNLSGGPCCGAAIEAPLLPPGETYLIKMPREGTSMWDVSSYRFADRTDREGRWVLEFERYLGFTGMPLGKEAS